jgi:CysZ protein
LSLDLQLGCVEKPMLDDASKALMQMVSPSFRQVLLKSFGLGLILIVIIDVALHGVFSWLATNAAAWAEAETGLHILWQTLAWLLSIAATFGAITGALFLMPAVTAFVGSFFVDEIAGDVERAYYPNETPGRALSISRALIAGIDTALLAVLVYLCAVPLLFLAGFGLVVMFVANAYLLGHGFFLLAAMRFRPPDEAKAMRRAYRGEIFFAGLLIAAFVSIPIINLATPLFAMAMMVHVHKRLSQRHVELQTV